MAVGAEASVVRAALMFTFVAFAPVVSRRAASLNALGAAALVLLTWRPSDLFDPSFQLTFLSVAAIVIFAGPYSECLKLACGVPLMRLHICRIAAIGCEFLRSTLLVGEKMASSGSAA